MKTFTKVKFSGQNDGINRNMKESMTIESWDAENKKGMHVTMATEKKNLDNKI